MSGEYDIVIAGGGLAGISLACALAPGGARMAVIEATPPKSDRPPSFDDRAIALAHGSRRIFEAIGLWKNIAGTATPIQKIHVSERGRFGFTHLDATEEGVPALGYVATARDLGQALLESFSTTGIDYYSPARLVDFDNQDDSVVMEIESGEGKRQISAKLLVAADGGQSQIRQRLGIDVRRWEYGHTAVVSNVLAGKPHANIAYERFTPDGPLAFLPLADGRCSIVWSADSGEARRLMELDDAGFCAALGEAFDQAHQPGGERRAADLVADQLADRGRHEVGAQVVVHEGRSHRARRDQARHHVVPHHQGPLEPPLEPVGEHHEVGGWVVVGGFSWT